MACGCCHSVKTQSRAPFCCSATSSVADSRAATSAVGQRTIATEKACAERSVCVYYKSGAGGSASGNPLEALCALSSGGGSSSPIPVLIIFVVKGKSETLFIGGRVPLCGSRVGVGSDASSSPALVSHEGTSSAALVCHWMRRNSLHSLTRFEFRSRLLLPLTASSCSSDSSEKSTQRSTRSRLHTRVLSCMPHVLSPAAKEEAERESTAAGKDRRRRVRRAARHSTQQQDSCR